MSKLRMVVSDLDGTLLDSDGQLHRLNIYALKRAAELGVIPVFATGRPARWLDPVDTLLTDGVLPITPWLIASNGAMLTRGLGTEKPRYFPLPRQDTIGVISDLQRAVPGISFAIEFADIWARSKTWGRRFSALNAQVVSDDPSELLAGENPLKLLFFRDGLETEALAHIAYPILGDRLNPTFSVSRASGFIECSAPGVTKGSTLRLLLDDLGISPAQVAAFGDMPNDIPMLDLVGMPFAMAESHSLLDCYPHTHSNDDGGVGRQLLELLGEPLPNEFLV
jgi:Cof subfamily protein (haloacid dehalogenase superfamily)